MVHPSNRIMIRRYNRSSVVPSLLVSKRIKPLELWKIRFWTTTTQQQPRHLLLYRQFTTTCLSTNDDCFLHSYTQQHHHSNDQLRYCSTTVTKESTRLPPPPPALPKSQTSTIIPMMYNTNRKYDSTNLIDSSYHCFLKKKKIKKNSMVLISYRNFCSTHSICFISKDGGSSHDRFGIGGNSLLTTTPTTTTTTSDPTTTTTKNNQYEEVIRTALLQHITTYEVPIVSTNYQDNRHDVELATILRKHLHLIVSSPMTSTNTTGTAATETETTKRRPIEILLRIGYRTMDNNNKSNNSSTGGIQTTTTTQTNNTIRKGSKRYFFPQDVQLNQQLLQSSQQQQQQQQQPSLSLLSLQGNHQPDNNTTGTAAAAALIVHNIHPEYIQSVLEQSHCVQLSLEYPKDIRIIVLLHNPEEQGSVAMTQSTMSTSTTLNPSTFSRNHHPNQIRTDEYRVRQDFIRTRLLISLQKLQHLVYNDDHSINNNNNKLIHGFGICSNGICLPTIHPYHLNYRDTILPAIQQAAAAVSSSEADEQRRFAFDVLQFPCNVMETTGLQLAKYIKSSNYDEVVGTPTTFDLKTMKLYCIRPLSCYPDLGTGTGDPFLLLDYDEVLSLLPLPTTTTTATASVEDSIQGELVVPEIYTKAYTYALRHFDANELLEQIQVQQQQQQENDGGGGGSSNNNDDPDMLTKEEIDETLAGCHFLQNVLHELHHDLYTVRSYKQYEKNLLTNVIPKLHQMFDSYDEDTYRILQSYFTAYQIAVKACISRNIRNTILLQQQQQALLQQQQQQQQNKEGDNDKEFHIASIPLQSTQRLQEFALEFVLKPKLLLLNHNNNSQNNDENDTEQQPEDSQPNNNNNNNDEEEEDDDHNYYHSLLIDKVLIGCTDPHHVTDNVMIVKKVS